MAIPPTYPLRIFFDGSCAVCAAEMSVYRREDKAKHLRFVDISAPGFDPTPYGIALAAFMYELHAIDRKKRIYRGVAAFQAIWQAFPASSRYGLFGTLIDLPGVNLLARLAYWGFARVRKFLPENSAACTDGTCRHGKHRPRR